MNITQGRDAIYSHFKDGWDANPVSSPVKVLYWDVGQDVPKTQDALTLAASPYVVARVMLNGGGQETLADQSGSAKFSRVGIFMLQINGPFGTGRTLQDNLIEVGMAIFEKKSAGNGAVWFRDVRPIDLGQTGEYFRTDILVDFQFSENR